MTVLGWIFFGLIAGFIASKVVNRQGEGCMLNVALGLVGSVVGGMLFSLLGEPVFWTFSLKSMLVAIVGAIVVLVLYHMATGRRTFR